MRKSVTPGAISTLLSNSSPDSLSDIPEIIIQVVDLKPIGSSSTRFTALIVTKCEIVCPSLGMEIKSDVKKEETGITLKPKQEALGVTSKPNQEMVTKSAVQIVREQHGNAAPAARLAMTRRVHPLASLNPYQGNWTIKGTQIQATMFNEAATKFYPKFELGKVYYISKGSLRVANKQFKTVQNDYEMTLNENSVVEEAEGEAFVPETKYNFVRIDGLGAYVNGRELNVSSTLSIRRKSNNDTIPKRDITIADDSYEGDEKYQLKLKEATWVPHLFRVSVAYTEYMNDRRQRITVRAEAPVDCAAESRYLLEEINKLSVS
ncbi:hypothetical protein BHE74_00031650 [Ensete ventricosum]|nr:hypothetical protein BHE74_00031650 [Ensete ventricosum]